jgi:aminotransferase
MSDKIISVFGSNFDETEVNRVKAVIMSQWVGMGAVTEEFERSLSLRLRPAHIMTMVNSGSNALHMAVHLMGLKPGMEVILPSFTWISCAHAVVMAGLKPVFCDIDADTQNVSIDTISPHITDRTGAIMVVHYAGKAVDLDPIIATGIPVIEDAAHAVDTMYKGRHCGTIGDIGIYSFDSVKNIAIGEAGGIVCRDKNKAEKARLLRYSGIEKAGFDSVRDDKTARWWEYNISGIFAKMLPTDISAAMGLAQLEKLDSNQQRRKKIWDYYQSEFAAIDGLCTPIDAPAGETHSYFTYMIQVSRRRDELAHYLWKSGIYTTLRYHPLHLNHIYKSQARLPVSERLNLTGLNIPLHPILTDAEINKVAATIKKFLNPL